MSRLKRLLHVANPSTRNTQQPLLQACKAVAQHTHTTQQKLLHVASPSTCNTQQAGLEGRAEARRQRLLAMLERDPKARYAVLTADDGNRPVIVAIAIRDAATAEIEIDRDRYDGMLILELLEKHTLH